MRSVSSAFILIILAAIVFACGCTGTQTSPAQQGEAVQEIVVGALLPLSGGFAEGGEASRVALETAAGDINDHFTAFGSDYRVGVIIEDTKTDPAVALEKLQALDKQGVRIVIGPGTSVELNATRTYADEHGIILISTMSTAPSLAIAGDNVYRFVPPDTYQADATAYCLKEEGITAIVPISRGDIWGDELEKLVAASFAKGNGTVLDGVRYVPGEKDYAGAVTDLDLQVGRAIAAHGKGKVGVYLISLDEAAAIMEAAAETKNLTEVRWYGCDGNVLLDTLVTGDAGRFAAQTKFTGPEFGQYERAVANAATVQKIQNALGRQPDGYSLASYDALWTVAMTRTQTDTTDVSKLKIALEWAAAGAGGPLCGRVQLDGAGDLATAHYTFWSVEGGGEAYRWVPVVQYDIWSVRAPPEIERIDA
ncbi:amino acid ABC transporter substrate-binding protein [Methanoculleus sp. Wushi-C6]|uniref:Amino acid ABC transporter substrate-binding protein n=1 Tax=Methanoculleus caldifontis TaxID=2651577 RepID=A0ABU3X0A5_9EURY|nr:ABC transporter substrate-binding protein [Methanoculleus sp. Wushi-C6]MDV2481477.1 amino acid ABC transporter substrate-binding protein [Methanoculleus sp. Wushi-C6]